MATCLFMMVAVPMVRHICRRSPREYDGALPLKDPLEGIDVDVHQAKVINSVR